MKQMRDRVVALNGIAPRFVNRENDFITYGRSIIAVHEMKKRVARLLGVGNA